MGLWMLPLSFLISCFTDPTTREQKTIDGKNYSCVGTETATTLPTTVTEDGSSYVTYEKTYQYKCTQLVKPQVSSSDYLEYRHF
jgi:hypothetical protein